MKPPMTRLWQTVLAREEEPCIDWTATAAEALEALRDGWGQWYPALADPLLDRLTADLGDASGDVWLTRLGQACTVLGLRLCLLGRDDDQYRFLVALPDDLATVAMQVADQGLSMSVLTEPGLQPGEPVPTANPGKTLAFAAVAISVPASWLPAATLASGRYALDSTWRWLDLADWPPRIGVPTSVAENVRWSASARICAASVAAVAGMDAGLHYAMTPPHLDPQWHALPVPRSKNGRPERICVHGFIGEDLFLLGVRKAWRIAGIGIRTTLSCDEITPPARQTGGNALLQVDSQQGLIVLGGHFHAWDQRGLRPMPLQIPSEGLETIPWIALGSSRFAWVQPWQKRILCIDVSTGEANSVTVPWLLDDAALHPCADGWLALTDAGRVTGAAGVLRFWNPQHNAWRRMPRASLGGAGATWVTVTPVGALLVGNDDSVLNMGDFAALIARMEPISLA